MIKYKAHFYCDECKDIHPFPIIIQLDDGPAFNGSLSFLFKGKKIPKNLALLGEYRINCLNKGSMTRQNDKNRIFLIPVGWVELSETHHQ